MTKPAGTRGILVDIEGDFETWARLSAKLLKRTPEERSKILEQFRVADRWAHVEQMWQQTMLAQLDAGDTTQSRRYGAICAEELKRRAKGEQAEEAQLVAPEASGLPSAAPSGDFRAQVMRAQGPASRPAKPETAAPASSLAEQMGAGEQVHAPAAGQQQTAATTVKPRQAMAMLRWEVERYAELCHAMSTAQRQEEVLASYGIDTVDTFRLGQKLWGERLVKERAMALRFGARMRELTGAGHD